MVRHLLFSLTLSWICGAAAQAPAQNFDQLFRDGLNAYQTKAYDNALDLFGQALAIEPGNTAAMTDYALAAFQLGKKGLAIAWFRRALALEPDLAEARAGLKFSLAKIDVKEIPHRIEAYETLRSDVLMVAPTRVFLAVTALLLLVAGWLFLSWLGARKRALQAQDVTPSFPLSAAICCFLALAGLALSGLKLYDNTLPRGTVLAKAVDALSAPAETGVPLFQLHEGFEVLIQDVKDDWVQITYPGGLTGWIPKKELIPSEGLATAR